MPYGETTSDEDRARYTATFQTEQGEGLYTFITVKLEPESYGITGSDELFQEIMDKVSTVPGLTLSSPGAKTWSDYQTVTLTPDE
jgi:hypothetical protein